ncbi:hypothetical protein NFI96_010428 [Prochilodus magdalenae]|nr:hypothetical protein NFI96_010428 [Prochilodus magdalenae]
MQRAGSANASNKFSNDSQRPVSRFSSVTSATPAKRITFFKSGDAQFSGVRMAIHKRSFKCFDALLDDLSQKVPLPFGVRTITTPRGTHSIQRLEQLEDGACYLCSDRRYVKPIDVEAAGKRPTIWHNSHPHNTRKKPSRPEEPPTGHSGQHYHRHPKRIVLVKNNDPTIDSIQSLMQCPSVLVCVGRESFKPLLLENLKKNSEEKLPGMGARSRSSICSEGHESKKNVNFGLETKKSIIHPRSDSSNRSTRFSLSSEKSYPNGLCMTPGQSAADLLREKVGNARPVSRGSNTSGNNCDLEELMNRGKIINDWLKNIPVDGPMYEMEDEFNVEHKDAVPQIVTVNEEEIGEISECNVMKFKESQEGEWAAGGGPVKEDNDVICNETLECNETFETNAANTGPSPPLKKTKKEGLSKRCHSSVQVMKVLLSPKLDRCNSLPEVSPVYGRKLSTSAKGLLECLANLQLIDPDPKNGKEEKYNEIISILQSLWICEPSENKKDRHRIIDHCSAEDEFNPRSSSGVDVSSGSIGSGKGSINGGVEKSETAGRVAPVIEQEVSQVQVDPMNEGEVDPSATAPEGVDTSHVPSDPLTPDIAERMRCSPENENTEEEQQIDEGSNAREEVTQSNEDQKGSNEAEFSNKSSGNDSNGLKSSTNNDTVSPENANSGTSNPRGILTRRVSQDPDPVWVLSLLKKLEKQFMSHYANAMAEFKVKWDLDDSEMLNKMISELKEEVHKRIQSSINRELQKIQSRAGRTPRPPISALSRDSTVQTEQRRRRLKVMRDKSINPSLSRSEDVNTASGTEFSDQRSDDEYCPCDACLKKKMASKAVQRAEALSLAPVLKDFDLRNILQKKKDPPATIATEEKLEEEKHLDGATNCSDVQNNLDVVHEESEAHPDVRGHTDEDTVELEGTSDATQTKDENMEEDATPVPENQDVDAVSVNDEEQGVEEGLTDDGNEAQKEDSAEDGEPENKEDGAEEGETETVEGEVLQEENETDDKGKMVESRDVSVAADGEAEDAEELAKEEDSSKKAAGIGVTGNSEHGDEEETTQDPETAEKENEDEDIEEKIKTAEESEVTEDEKEEETESVHELGKPENIETENEISDTNEVEAKGDSDTTNKSESEAASETDGEDNQAASSQAEDEAENEADEDQTETEQEEQQMSTLKASEDEDVQADEENQSDERNQNDIEVKSTDEAENQAKGPDHNSEKGAENQNDASTEGLAEQVNSDATEADASGEACGEDSGPRLIKQITKTSVESQPGSMEYATDQRVKAKLKDIRSFMDSSESQEDSIVVIVKQSPFTERRNVSVRPGNKEEVGNEVIEWQVSPKRRNRSPARANKQRRPKDSEVKVDDLEF